jgi:ABC-type phosphate transport system substrate-binding protein
VTGTLGHPATTPDGRAPTDRVQLGEGLLLNRRDRFTVMVVLSGTPSDARRRIRQTGSLIGGRVVAEPPRRGPNTRSMLFGGSVALPLAGLLLGLLVSLNPPPGSQCTGGSLQVEGSTAFAPAAQQIARQYMASCHAAHITVSAIGSVAGLNALAAQGARNPGAAIAMSDGPAPPGHQYIPLSPTPIGVIIFTVVVNSGTHVATLTTPQIRGIFTGAYKDWKELGGAPGPIRIVSRYPNSGSQRAFDNFVLGGTEPPPSSYDCTDKNLIATSRVVLCQEPSTQALLQMVASIPGAVGYAEASDASVYTGQGAQPVDLNGLPDTFGNVGTSSLQYPFWTVEYLYTYGAPAPSSLAGKFVAYVQSSSTFLRANDVTPCAGLMRTLCAPGAR